MSGRTQARACPERTCVGCRERAVKSDLLRIVAIEDECVPDPRGTLPGRGAYVHPAVVCLDQAVRRRAFPGPFGPPEHSTRRNCAKPWPPRPWPHRKT
ncbi:YlxR family protein [Streptomyces sp. MS1.HAVA.3]|uniref:YlxR family protein n=1 Tax=Streptomyces caledonius TaxID=3134107 RepID=A0ABU8U301_9ACTN